MKNQQWNLSFRCVCRTLTEANFTALLGHHVPVNGFTTWYDFLLQTQWHIVKENLVEISGPAIHNVTCSPVIQNHCDQSQPITKFWQCPKILIKFSECDFCNSTHLEATKRRTACDCTKLIGWLQYSSGNGEM